VLGLFRKRKRRRLLTQALDERQRDIVEKLVPYVRHLDGAKRSELEGLMHVFLAEKRFEGCGGLVVTDEMRLAIAAQACVLLLGRPTDVYPLLMTVLVYPRAYVSREPALNDHGVLDPTPVERIGESWARGSVVLSWDDVERGGALDGVNVAYHEFAHQLDDEHGEADGTPPLADAAMRKRWIEVMTREYEALVQSADAGRDTLLDEYGAESPAEFFAVATETFFERAAELRREHPDLYALLADFYRQDPASSVPPGPRLRRRVRRHPRQRD
jgi:Mlc titration factor MtfA (ptsG expression regulator)